MDLEQENLKRFVQVMNELGYRPRVPVRAEDFSDPANREMWKREKGMEVFSFFDQSRPMSLIDVFIDEKIPFEEIERDMVHVTAKGITIPVVSISHLKKPFAFRPSPDALREFKNASAEAKLDWLEAANRFVHDFVPPQKLERWKKISKQ